MRRLLPRPTTLHAARRATAIALLFQWLIVITGSTVRLTGSGLGCPDWPTCTSARAMPELSMHPMIEFLNRVTATPTLLAALVAAWACWRLAPRRRDLRVASGITVLGTLTQAGVGAMTVILELPPGIVSAHFLLSIACIASATVAWHAAGSSQPLRLAPRGSRIRVVAGALMLLSLFAVIVAGVLTTASGPHSGGAGTGHAPERLGIFELAATLHARGAYAFLALVLVLTWARSRRGVALRDLGALLLLVVAQVLLGEVQYRNGLPWEVVLAHVANAALMWIVAVGIAVDAATAPAGPGLRPEPSAPGATVDGALPGAPPPASVAP